MFSRSCARYTNIKNDQLGHREFSGDRVKIRLGQNPTSYGIESLIIIKIFL